jgi:antitoxin component of RelBE/YafQ-DinJ toxin-antitoxin module
MTIRVDEETYDKLAYTGGHLGIATATVARIWLKQRADEIWVPPKIRPKKQSQSSSKAPPTVRQKNPDGTRAERRSKKK